MMQLIPESWIWCPEPESNRYAGIIQATDFKSVVSTNFTTRASGTCVPTMFKTACDHTDAVEMNQY